MSIQLPGQDINLSLEGELTEGHYLEMIDRLKAGLKQFRSMKRREGQRECATCGDNDHTSEQCWYFNPLLLSLMGIELILGNVFRCFHCGAIFTSEEGAEGHFGKTPSSIPECLQQLAELADEEERRFEIVDGLVEPK